MIHTPFWLATTVPPAIWSTLLLPRYPTVKLPTLLHLELGPVTKTRLLLLLGLLKPI